MPTCSRRQPPNIFGQVLAIAVERRDEFDVMVEGGVESIPQRRSLPEIFLMAKQHQWKPRQCFTCSVERTIVDDDHQWRHAQRILRDRANRGGLVVCRNDDRQVHQSIPPLTESTCPEI